PRSRRTETPRPPRRLQRPRRNLRRAARRRGKKIALTEVAMKSLFAVATVFYLAASVAVAEPDGNAEPSAPASESWVGVKVVPKPRGDDRDDRDKDEFRVDELTVRKDRGDSVMIRNRRREVWIEKSRLIRFDEAIEYYDEYLRKHPN